MAASFLKSKQHVKTDVINLADMKVLMRTLGQAVNAERLKEALNASRAKDVRNKIDLDFVLFLQQLHLLVEDPPCSDNDVRKSFSTLEHCLAAPKGYFCFEFFVVDQVSSGP